MGVVEQTALSTLLSKVKHANEQLGGIPATRATPDEGSCSSGESGTKFGSWLELEEDEVTLDNAARPGQDRTASDQIAPSSELS